MPLKVEQLIKSLVNATEVKQLYDRVSSKISFQAEELSSTCFELARIHHYGLGSTPKDLDKAFRLYVKAAKKNHPIAQFVICQLYDWEKNSIDSTEDIERMIAFKAEMYVNSASQSVYYCGAHEELYRHCKKSVSWRDIINSMELKFYSRLKFEEDTDKSGYNYNRLGYVLILKGSWNILERKKSYKKAIKCFRKAAKLGNADAYWNISYWIYYLGYGYPKNISKYNKYLKLAADYGHPVAISIMVSLYYSEDLKDLNSSYCCRGYVEFLYRNFPTAFASYYFALMFLYGLGGVKKNPLLAIQLLEESVVRSDFIFSFANQWSSFLLAFIYYKGIGAKKDITAAMHYFALAASLGYDEAYPYIAKLLLQHKLLPSADKKASLLLHFAKDNSPIDTSTNRLATYYLGKMKANDDHSGSLKESKEYLDQTFVSYRASLVEDPSANVYYRLGRILESDFGRYRDLKKARMYYRLAYNVSLKTRNQFTRLYGEKAKKRVQTDSKRRRKMIRDETVCVKKSLTKLNCLRVAKALHQAQAGDHSPIKKRKDITHLICGGPQTLRRLLARYRSLLTEIAIAWISDQLTASIIKAKLTDLALSFLFTTHQRLISVLSGIQ
ncbi:uncharacterized protein TRIADDRAFT_61821 [Trichoplax adhaerens]|uniref:Uncharacterized protein n=1 Tax=Trichoplax adhaerens TaxID=10228 RepID=B3SC21_TRIAD|nr:hypothetical protein TRIADDRAFT_61821 [Trichoplax adhaerens]EDV19775.1 hypothetical protein TRIADDRAFT_61821 [Trichoplax adhaerens]|eukprot:XP_002117799.1 hypothetical protein TRIADDRAFT_61821 [Trichoplax adhaerens]